MSTGVIVASKDNEKEKKDSLWRRLENLQISRRSLKHKSYPDTIGWVSDPSHPNPNIRERAIAIDTDPGTTSRMLGEWDRSGSSSAALDPLSGRGYHGQPTVYSVRNIRTIWRGRGNKASSSKGLECIKCSMPLAPAQAELVPDSNSITGYDYRHKQHSWGGCVQVDTDPDTGYTRRQGR